MWSVHALAPSIKNLFPHQHAVPDTCAHQVWSATSELCNCWSQNRHLLSTVFSQLAGKKMNKYAAVCLPVMPHFNGPIKLLATPTRAITAISTPGQMAPEVDSEPVSGVERFWATHELPAQRAFTPIILPAHPAPRLQNDTPSSGQPSHRVLASEVSMLRILRRRRLPHTSTLPLQRADTTCAVRGCPRVPTYHHTTGIC